MGEGGEAEQTLPRFFFFLEGLDHYEELKISVTFVAQKQFDITVNP